MPAKVPGRYDGQNIRYYQPTAPGSRSADTSSLLGQPSTASYDFSGSGSIDSTPSLAGTGQKAGQGTGGISSTGAITVSGRKEASGGGIVASANALTGSGARAASGSGLVSATTSLTGSGQMGADDAGVTSATGILTGSGAKAASGAGSLPGVGSLTGSGSAGVAVTATPGSRGNTHSKWALSPLPPVSPPQRHGHGGGAIVCRVHAQGRGVRSRSLRAVQDEEYLVLQGAL